MNSKSLLLTIKKFTFMKRYNLMFLKKGNTRYSFQGQFLSRIAAVKEGMLSMRDPAVSSIYVAYKVVPCYRKRFYYFDK